MQFSPLPSLLVPPKPKYSPRHPTLKHPHSTFFPQYQRPSFKPTQNKKQNNGSVNLNLYMFYVSNWKTKVFALNKQDINENIGLKERVIRLL
jgi:hypothetical protein